MKHLSRLISGAMIVVAVSAGIAGIAAASASAASGGVQAECWQVYGARGSSPQR